MFPDLFSYFAKVGNCKSAFTKQKVNITGGNKMKRLKTAWAVLLCLCMAVTLLPITAFAAENYGVTVNNIAVTDENADDVLGDSTVSYDLLRIPLC